MKQLCLVSLISLVCHVPALAQVPDQQAKQNTVLFVTKLQTASGGFVAEPSASKKPPTLRATSSAVQAIKYLGGELPNKDAVSKFIASCFDKASGGFADTPGGKPDVATTAVGLIAVGELGLPAEPYHAAATNYLAANAKSFDDIRIAVAGLERIKVVSPKQKEWIAETLKLNVPAPPMDKQPDGRARVLAGQTVTLLRLGQTPKDTAAILKDLKNGQRDNGGYGKEGSPKADLESCYRVMRAFMMLKTQPDNVAGLRGFIQKCRNADHGYGVAPGEPSTISGVYYAAIITYWLDKQQ